MCCSCWLAARSCMPSSRFPRAGWSSSSAATLCQTIGTASSKVAGSCSYSAVLELPGRNPMHSPPRAKPGRWCYDGRTKRTETEGRPSIYTRRQSVSETASRLASRSHAHMHTNTRLARLRMQTQGEGRLRGKGLGLRVHEPGHGRQLQQCRVGEATRPSLATSKSGAKAGKQRPPRLAG